MKKLVTAVFISAMALVIPNTASAATILLDFASALYSGANGLPSFSTTDQGVGVNIQSGPLGSTINYLPAGLGVNFPILPDDTELGAAELLTISFTTPQFVDSIAVQLLFGNPENEQGLYSINGGLPVLFTGNSGTGNRTLAINQDHVNFIQFVTAPGLLHLADDYTVRSINVQAVPEPASMVLLGTGLLYGARRRYRMKQQR
jgi:hypothetical protein